MNWLLFQDRFASLLLVTLLKNFVYFKIKCTITLVLNNYYVGFDVLWNWILFFLKFWILKIYFVYIIIYLFIFQLATFFIPLSANTIQLTEGNIQSIFGKWSKFQNLSFWLKIDITNNDYVSHVKYCCIYLNLAVILHAFGIKLTSNYYLAWNVYFSKFG